MIDYGSVVASRFVQTKPIGAGGRHGRSWSVARGSKAPNKAKCVKKVTRMRTVGAWDGRGAFEQTRCQRQKSPDDGETGVFGPESWPKSPDLDFCRRRQTKPILTRKPSKCASVRLIRRQGVLSNKPNYRALGVKNGDGAMEQTQSGIVCLYMEITTLCGCVRRSCGGSARFARIFPGGRLGISIT